MQKINSIDFDTLRGLRYVELFLGDILNLGYKTDLLVVSAFQGAYNPKKGTLVGSLMECGVDLDKIMKKPELDLRSSLSSALTPLFKNHSFNRILVFEMKNASYFESGQLGLEEIFDNLFISLMVLEKKGYKIKSIAMPLIGTGDQNISVEDIAEQLPEMTRKFFNELIFLEKLIFVDRNADKIKYLSSKVDEKLGRSEIVLVKDSFTTNLKKSIEEKIPILKKVLDTADSVLDELHEAMRDTNSSPHIIFLNGRKLLEYIMSHLLKTETGDLFTKISRLRDIHVAPWVISSMHLIRVFGNDSAHLQDPKQIPIKMKQEDIILNIVCIDRILDFSIEYFGSTNSN